MFCNKCGKEIKDESSFCNFCGANLRDEISIAKSSTDLHQNTNVEGFCCPKCGGRHLQATNKTDLKTSGKNFSAGQGCLGYLLFGPLGILCGSCGQSKKVTATNSTCWVCPDCGNTFISPDDLRAQAKEQNKSAIVSLIAGIICSIFLYIIMYSMNSSMSSASLVSMISAIIVFVPFALYSLALFLFAAKKNKEADKTEIEMKKFK